MKMKNNFESIGAEVEVLESEESVAEHLIDTKTPGVETAKETIAVDHSKEIEQKNKERSLKEKIFSIFNKTEEEKRIKTLAKLQKYNIYKSNFLAYNDYKEIDKQMADSFLDFLREDGDLDMKYHTYLGNGKWKRGGNISDSQGGIS